MLATPEMDGCLPAIARLTALFGGRVWLVSKCGPRVQARTLRWLDAHDFYGRTGVTREHVRFCRARADKRAHCAELRLTHFVDDHPEVHAAIRDAVEHQYFFGPQRRPVPAYGMHAADWADAVRLIEASPTVAGHVPARLNAESGAGPGCGPRGDAGAHRPGTRGGGTAAGHPPRG